MEKRAKEERRSQIGYGTTYRKAKGAELQKGPGIGAVLGGQVWVIKPDKKADAGNPCIWMQAGVVEFKTCNNFYSCTTCKYDAGMKKQVEQGKTSSWQDAMRRKSPLERVCRHSLTQRIETRRCAYDYVCSTCDFDQFFEDVWSPKVGTFPREVQEVKGFAVPMGYYFHDGHTWARIESGGLIRVGMDDFALKLLGQADGLDLPLMGKELDGGKPGWGLKRKGNAAGVLSPIDGVITDVNASVRENPGEANREPYGNGWLFVVKTPDLKGAMKRLMPDTDALAWVGEEVSRLEGMIEEVAGPLATDGGFLREDIYGAIPALGWDRLTRSFLRS